MPKKISQVQIARGLGVSQSLVSIVLNGRKEGIAKSTYERIWEFAMKNGYSPKGMKLPVHASQPAMRAVGYMLRAPLRLSNNNIFFNHVAQGLYEYLSEKQVNMIFLGSEMDIPVEELRTTTWKRKALSGIVIMGGVQPDFLSAARDLDIPIVYICARVPGVCHSVNSNEFQAAEQLVDHLYKLGHRKIIYLREMCASGGVDEKYEGLSRALIGCGIKIADEVVLALAADGRRQGYQLAEKLLRMPAKQLPSAWVCENGILARGVVDRLEQEGLRAGEDISVVAFDNTRVCYDELPGISSAHSIPEDLGREAGRILLNPDLQEVDSLLDVVLPSKFSHRETSGPASLEISERVLSLRSDP